MRLSLMGMWVAAVIAAPAVAAPTPSGEPAPMPGNVISSLRLALLRST